MAGKSEADVGRLAAGIDAAGRAAGYVATDEPPNRQRLLHGQAQLAQRG